MNDTKFEQCPIFIKIKKSRKSRDKRVSDKKVSDRITNFVFEDKEVNSILEKDIMMIRNLTLLPSLLY